MCHMVGDIRSVLFITSNIKSLARFAVQDYNKKQNGLLEFRKVVSAKHQVVSGSMYYITLEATDGGKKKRFETKIWEQPWLNFKEVQEFKYVGDAPMSLLARLWKF